jgi:hypothetical protein
LHNHLRVPFLRFSGGPQGFQKALMRVAKYVPRNSFNPIADNKTASRAEPAQPREVVIVALRSKQARNFHSVPGRPVFRYGLRPCVGRFWFIFARVGIGITKVVLPHDHDVSIRVAHHKVNSRFDIRAAAFSKEIRRMQKVYAGG